MPAERSITAKLLLDKSQFSRELVTALAEAKAFEKAMSNLGGDHGSIFNSEDVDRWSTSVDDASDSVDNLNTSLRDGNRNGNAFGKGIAASNSHMALLVQYSLALGPALVPTLAAAVPLVTALGSGLAFAAVGAGTAVLAFQGIGDALSAMHDYALDPTEARLQKLNETMDAIGPAGRGFVVFLDSLRPKLQQLQDIAQEGMFPGIQEGIESLLTQLPLVKGVIESVSSAMGQLAADTGEALTSPFWTDFFEYIRDDASTIIADFSTGFGKLFEGIAALVLDFAPLTEDIAAGFANMGRSFSEWAQGLPQTEGFQEFIRYLRETGPQVIETLGNLGKALLDITVALSGLPAQTSLLILNTLATVLSQIAASPIGPGLLATAVGLAAITRAIAVWDTVQASAIMQFLGTGGKGTPQGTSILSRAGSLATVSNLTKVAGAVGLVALSMTDLDEKAGLSSTLTGAAIGLIFTPWAAAAGAVAGATLDAAAANDELTDSLDRVESAIEDTPGDFSAQAAALTNSAKELDKFRESTDHSISSANDYLARTKNITEDVFGKSDVEEATERQDELTEKFRDGARGVSELARALGDADAPTGKYKDHLEELTKTATDLEPALDHLNVSFGDIRNLGAGLDSENPLLAGVSQVAMSSLADDIERYQNNLVTTAGKEKAVAAALRDLGAEAGNTQENIDALSDALDELFSPALAYSRALDDWRQGLADLNENLKGTSLSAFTTQGRENREVIRGLTEDLLTLVTADLQEHPNKGPGAVALQMLNARKEMVQFARQAGIEGPKLQAFLDSLHLTPKDLKFVFDKAGIDLAEAKAKELKKAYEDIPEKVRTKVEADGVQADVTVKDLMRKYEGLSRYDAKTIVRAVNNADPVLNDIRYKLGLIEKPRTVNINVNAGAAIGTILGVQSALNNLHDRTVYVNQITTGSQTRRKPFRGGRISGPGGPRDDKIPAMLSDGEFVVNAKATAANLDTLFRINSEKFADGGLAMVKKFADGGRVGRIIRSGEIGDRSVRDDTIFIDKLTIALGRMRKEARQVERAEDAVHRARVRSREATQRLEQAERNEHTSKERLRDLQRQVNEATKRQTYTEKELAKQRDQLSEATQKWKDIQGRLLQQAQAASSAALSQGDIFGGQGTSVSVGGILAKLRQTGKDAREFNHYINRLRGMGVNERIIQQLLEQGPTPEGLATAKNLANASKGQIRDINRAERRLVGASSAVGATSISHNTTVNFKIEKVVGMDADDMGKAWPKQMRRALRLARSAS